jgi:hypothetical protein
VWEAAPNSKGGPAGSFETAEPAPPASYKFRGLVEML